MAARELPFMSPMNSLSLVVCYVSKLGGLMGFEQFQDVVIATDRFEEIGVRRGMSATVLDLYEDGAYEIQVHDTEGEIDCFAVQEGDLLADTSKRTS